LTDYSTRLIGLAYGTALAGAIGAGFLWELAKKAFLARGAI